MSGDRLKIKDNDQTNFNHFIRFVEIMTQLEAVGWVRVQKKESEELTELDIDEIFKMIDVDKSGSISRSVSCCDNSTRLWICKTNS